jgi:hypothetical protein
MNSGVALPLVDSLAFWPVVLRLTTWRGWLPFDNQHGGMAVLANVRVLLNVAVPVSR